MGLVNQEDNFDDTEFVVGSDPSGMPPGMRAVNDDEVEIDIEDDAPAPKKEAKAEPEDDIEIEVVDDTPKSDRGREPLPDEVKEELENVDAEEYSAKVKQRIDQMKKAWHDERREKEAALREREEAARLTKQLMEERNKLRKQLSDGEGWALDQAKQRAALQLEQAKRAYRDAYEQGDSEMITNAQQELSRATYQAEQMAGGLGSYQKYLTEAEAATGPKAYQAYMSPYQQDVIDTTLAEFDVQAQKGLPGLANQAIQAGAFGGGREGVQRAEYQAASDRNRAALQAQLLGQGFSQAQNLAQQDLAYVVDCKPNI